MSIQRSFTGTLTAMLFLSVGAIASADERASAFAEFEVAQRDKPFPLDCAEKHAKYFNLDDDAPMLASISGDQSGHDFHKQARSRSGYSSQKVGYQAPDVSLVDGKGNLVKVADLLETDQPVMLNFIFTTCTTICPVLSASFKQVQGLLGDEAEEVLMISITIDPEYDTPEKLNEYAQRFSAGEQWQFFTGQVDDVIAVEKAFDIFRGSKTNHEPVTFMRAGKDAEWLRIEGFANAGELVGEYNKLVKKGT